MDRTGPARRNTAYDWYVVVALFTVSVLGYVDRVILSFLIEPIKAELQFSDAQIGLITGLAFAALYVFGGVFIGRMLDGGRRVLILAVCVLVWSIATAVSGLATGFASLFVARMFVGVGEAGLNPAAIGIISDRFAADRVQKPIGLFTTGLYVGGGLAMMLGGQLLAQLAAGGPYVLPLIGEAAPWRIVFVLLGIPGVIVAAVILTTVRDPQRSVAARADAAAAGGALAFARANVRLIALLAASIVTWSMNNYGLLNWYPAMMMRSFGMAPSLVATTYGPAFLIGGIAGCVAVAPYLALLRRRYADSAPFVLCLTTMAALSITTLAGPLMPTITGVVVMAFVNLFISAMTVTSVFVLIVTVAPPHLRAVFTGLYMALVNLTGGAFGSVMVGLITDHVVGAQSLNLALAIMALSFGPVSALLMYGALRARRLG
ncbi:MAG: MFS transporter [Pseudomonadota bacterium]